METDPNWCQCGQPNDIHLMSFLTQGRYGNALTKQAIGGCNGFLFEAGMNTIQRICKYFVDRREAVEKMQGGLLFIEACLRFQLSFEHILEETGSDVTPGVEVEYELPPVVQLTQKFRKFVETGNVGDAEVIEATTEELGTVARVIVSLEMMGGLEK